MYRDSQHGLTIDLNGVWGNVYMLFAAAQQFNKQLGRPRNHYKQHLDLAFKYYESHAMGVEGYLLAIAVFEYHFPFVTLLNKPEEIN